MILFTFQHLNVLREKKKKLLLVNNIFLAILIVEFWVRKGCLYEYKSFEK